MSQASRQSPPQQQQQHFTVNKTSRQVLDEFMARNSRKLSRLLTEFAFYLNTHVAHRESPSQSEFKIENSFLIKLKVTEPSSTANINESLKELVIEMIEKNDTAAESSINETVPKQESNNSSISYESSYNSHDTTNSFILDQKDKLKHFIFNPYAVINLDHSLKNLNVTLNNPVVYISRIHEIIEQQTSEQLIALLLQVFTNHASSLRHLDLSYFLGYTLAQSHREVAALLHSASPFPHLTKLDLSNLNLSLEAVTDINDRYSMDFCAFFRKNGSSIKELCLKNCMLPERFMLEIIGLVPNIESLDVSGNIDLDGDFLQNIENYDKLVKLYMSFCCNLDKEKLLKLLMRLNKLTHLGLASSSENHLGLDSGSDLFEPSLLEFISNVMNERLCVIKYNFSWRESDMMDMLSNLVNLEQLDLTNSHFDEQGNAGLAKLLNTSTRLKCLVLTGCVNANDTAFTSSEIRTPLRELFLSDAVTELTIDSLARSCAVQQSLAKLSVMQAQEVGAEVTVGLLDRFERLEMLEVNGRCVSEIDDQVRLVKSAVGHTSRRVELFGLSAGVLAAEEASGLFAGSTVVFNRVCFGRVCLVFEPMKQWSY